MSADPLAQALAEYGAKVRLIRKLRSGTQEAEIGARQAANRFGERSSRGLE